MNVNEMAWQLYLARVAAAHFIVFEPVDPGVFLQRAREFLAGLEKADSAALLAKLEEQP